MVEPNYRNGLLSAAVATAVVLTLASMGTAAAMPQEERRFTALLSGDQEVPPVDTDAHGVAKFHLSADGKTLHFELHVFDIDNVFGAHIHKGVPGENGPIVAFLFGNLDPGMRDTPDGLLSEGMITKDDLTGPLEGMALADLVALLESRGAYVNVHTNDGEDPAGTGAGDMPTGEIRGVIVESTHLDACAPDVMLHPKEDGVHVTWSHAEGAVKYVILRANADDPHDLMPVGMVHAPMTMFVDETAEAGVTYHYAVHASDGMADDKKCEETATVTAIPFFPGVLGTLAALAGAVAIAGTVAWTARRR